MRYIQLLPPEKRPVAGTEGAAYRRQQMARQLPEHDQDPSKCHELSPAEVKKMEQFVRKYKDEALGIGDVLLPEDMALVQAGGKSGTGAAAAGAAGPGGDQAAGTRPAGAGMASGPARGATGTAATAGAMSVPGAQPAAGQQQTFVSTFFHLHSTLRLVPMKTYIHIKHIHMYICIWSKKVLCWL